MTQMKPNCTVMISPWPVALISVHRNPLTQISRKPQWWLVSTIQQSPRCPFEPILSGDWIHILLHQTGARTRPLDSNASNITHNSLLQCCNNLLPNIDLLNTPYNPRAIPSPTHRPQWVRPNVGHCISNTNSLLTFWLWPSVPSSSLFSMSMLFTFTFLFP